MSTIAFFSTGAAALSGARNGTLGRVVGAVTRLRDNRRNRRAVAALHDLDERLLVDIGVTRGDVSRALALPSTADASLALASFARARYCGWERLR